MLPPVSVAPFNSQDSTHCHFVKSWEKPQEMLLRIGNLFVFTDPYPLQSGSLLVAHVNKLMVGDWDDDDVKSLSIIYGMAAKVFEKQGFKFFSIFKTQGLDPGRTLTFIPSHDFPTLIIRIKAIFATFFTGKLLDQRTFKSQDKLNSLHFSEVTAPSLKKSYEMCRYLPGFQDSVVAWFEVT